MPNVAHDKNARSASRLLPFRGRGLLTVWMNELQPYFRLLLRGMATTQAIVVVRFLAKFVGFR
jgi:hypothetical protein